MEIRLKLYYYLNVEVWNYGVVNVNVWYDNSKVRH